MTRRVSVFSGDSIWDDAQHMYRPITGWDPLPLTRIFQVVAERCDDRGYHKVIFPWTNRDLIPDEPFIDLLMSQFTLIVSIKIFEMAFGTVGCRDDNWGTPL
jgi:hypothetical protein